VSESVGEERTAVSIYMTDNLLQKLPGARFLSVPSIRLAAKPWYFLEERSGKSIATTLAMDWRQVENHWQQFNSFARKQWKRLTEDDLAAIGGRRAALIKRLEESYGMTTSEAGDCVDQWLRMSQDAETVEMHPGTAGQRLS
jgi:hypothetical protein